VFNASALNRAALNGRAYALRLVAATATATCSAAAVATGSGQRAASAAATARALKTGTAQRAAAGFAVGVSRSLASASQSVSRGGFALVSGQATGFAYAPNQIALTANFRGYAFSLAVAQGQLGNGSVSATASFAAIADRVKFSSATAVAVGLAATNNDVTVVDYAEAVIVAKASGIGTGRVKPVGWTGFLNTGLVDFPAFGLAHAVAKKQTLASRPMSASALAFGQANKRQLARGQVAIGTAVFSSQGENITLSSASAVISATCVANRKVTAGGFAAIGGVSTLAGLPTQLQHGFANGDGLAVVTPQPGITRGVSASMTVRGLLVTPYLPVRRGGFAAAVGQVFLQAYGVPTSFGEGAISGSCDSTAVATRDRTIPFSGSALASGLGFAAGQRWRIGFAAPLASASGYAVPSRFVQQLAVFVAAAGSEADGITNPATRAPSSRVFKVLADNRQMRVSGNLRQMKVV